MADGYHYVRYTWWRRVDLEEVAATLDGSFYVKTKKMPSDDREIALYRDFREGLNVKADTLGVNLSPVRAVLYQKESAPFTARDVELREKILELYPRDRPTPFPLFYSKEPEFEVAELIKRGSTTLPEPTESNR